jgi:non-heme chloroperoxidase
VPQPAPRTLREFCLELPRNDCIKVFSETEFFDDLKIIDIPVLVMHSQDDQIAPFAVTGAKSVKLLKKGTLKSYPDLPHGTPATHPEIINKYLLAFLKR